MFKRQALVTHLLQLGEKDRARALVDKDIADAVKEFSDKLLKEDDSHKGDSQLEGKFRDILKEKYCESLRLPKAERERREEAETANSERRSQRAREEEQRKRQAEARKSQAEAEKKNRTAAEALAKRTEEVAKGSNDVANRLNNAVDAAYAAIFVYCKQYRPTSTGTDASPFEKQLEEFRSAGATAAADAVPHETGTLTFSSSDLLRVATDSCAAVLSTPVGNFPRVGKLRSGVIEFTDGSDDDLSPSAPARKTREFEAAIVGAVFVTLCCPGHPHPQIARRVGAWLQHDDIGVDSEQARRLAASAPWTMVAALSRTALLLLKAWSDRLLEIKHALQVPKDVLEVRIKRHLKQAPLESEKVFNELRDVCKEELMAVVAARAADFQTAIRQSKIRAGEVLDRINTDTDLVVGGWDKETVTVTLSEAISRSLADDVRTRFEKLFASVEKTFNDAWRDYILERIVLYHLGSAVGERFLKDQQELVQRIRSEIIVPPAPTEIAYSDLEERLKQFLDRAKGSEFSTQVVNYANWKAIYEGIGKLPSRMLAFFAPIFAISMLLGFGGVGLVKGFTKDLAEGWEPSSIVLAVALVVVLMLAGTYVSLIRRQIAQKAAFASLAKAKLTEIHGRMLKDLETRYFLVAKQRLDRSLADVLRRMRVHFDLHLADRRASWQNKLLSLQHERGTLEVQAEVLDELFDSELADALKEVSSAQKDLRKLAREKLLDP